MLLGRLQITDNILVESVIYLVNAEIFVVDMEIATSSGLNINSKAQISG